MKGRETLSAFWAPNFEWLLVVFAARNDETFGRVPINALDVGTMATEHALLKTSIEIPNAYRAIVRTGGELRVRRAPAEFKLHTGMRCS